MNTFAKIIGWCARNWMFLFVIFGPGLVNFSFLGGSNEDFRAAFARSNAQFSALLVAIAVIIAPGVAYKWHLALATALAVLNISNSLPTSPAPAIELAISVIVFATSGLALYAPYGSLAARTRQDISNYFAKLKTSAGDEHGSSRWATQAEILSAFSNGGVVLGQIKTFAKVVLVLTMLKIGHVLVVAGSRAGKTSNFVIPTALSWLHSLVVLDPKGEVAAVCADYRRKLGQSVFIFEHRAPETTSFINVFDWLDASSPRFVEDCQNAAGWLYAERSKGEGGGSSDAGKFFEATARTMLELAIARLKLSDAEACTPRNVRRFVAQPVDELQKAVKTLAKVEHENELLRDYIRDLAGSLSGADAKTFANICTSTTADTKWLASPNLAAIVSGGPENAGDIDDRIVRTSQILAGNTSIFVCVSPDVLKTSPGFARVLIGALLQQHYHSVGNVAKDKVLYLLDEAPQLGDADIIEMTLRVGAGYNAMLAYVTQDLASIEQRFGKNGTRAFLENCAIKLMLGVSGDLETAKWVSDMSGDATILSSSVSSSTQASGTVGDQLIKRNLLTQREVLDISPDEAILFARSMRPMRIKKAFYKAIPELAARAQPNPFDGESPTKNEAA